MTLPTRKIGDAEVTAIGYGAMGISTFYGAAKPDPERFAFLDKLFELGCTNWDTADMYGDSEELLGKWFKKTGKRGDVFLASKFGFTGKPERMINGSPEYVKAACARSLSRLGVNQLDLYYLHRPDTTVPIEETVGAMAELVKEGKVKYLGLSEVTEDSLRRAHAVHPIAALQIEYSPFCTDIETPDVNLLKACRELGVAVVAYSPLGRGVLTGKYNGPEDFEEGDFRRSVPKFSKDNFPKILKIADTMKDVGKAHGGAPAGAVCLAWLLAQGADIVPIPGTTRIENLKENLAALEIKLSAEEVQKIRDAVRDAEIVGERYSKAGMATVLVDTPPLRQ